MNPEQLKKRFGAAIRRRRGEKLSQEELARRAGLHRTYISNLERGRRNPSLVVMARLATALKTHLDELVADLRRPTSG